jgi:membrane-associated protease RseP (regulator of RpoE activity)
MMDLRARHTLPALLALALGACATTGTAPPVVPGAPPVVTSGAGRYEPLRQPEVVTELRAAPAKDTPEVSDSQSPEGDERVLGGKGFVRIANGRYAAADEKAREWLVARGREAGADRVLIYPDNADGSAGLRAAYYVRFKLPFGASFRDLHADEREAVGGGVSLGEVIGNSPAAEALLLKGDIVVKFNGEAIRDRAHFQKLLRANMGKRVPLVISRGGTTLTRTVRLGVLATDGDGVK